MEEGISTEEGMPTQEGVFIEEGMSMEESVSMEEGISTGARRPAGQICGKETKKHEEAGIWKSKWDK